MLLFAIGTSYANVGLAVSAGKNFGDGVDTREDAIINASSAYKSAGYRVVTLKDPTKSDFTNTRLKADILFLSGHGNENVLVLEHINLYVSQVLQIVIIQIYGVPLEIKN